MTKKIKLVQAQEILEALGLPKQQYNKRSAWVFLALANIRPKDEWKNAKSSLLPTVDIMQFIRKYYGQNYKPNTRETIRRQTLHQFEQARIVDRNRDNPSRATNSKYNNYSLNQTVIKVLRKYPNNNWKQKIKEYEQDLPKLKRIYERTLNKTKIPIKIRLGKEINLSPGKHNQLQKDIVDEFCSRFIGQSGMVLYMGDTAKSRNEGGKYIVLEEKQLKAIGISIISHGKLPDLIAYDKKRKRVFLIEAVTSHGPVSSKRYIEMEKILKNCKVQKIYVSAFPNIKIFRQYIANIAWETEVWIADSPDHMIHFNGDHFL